MHTDPDNTRPGGNIKTWQQKITSNPAKNRHFDYDRADQVESATLFDSVGTPPPVLKQLASRYDDAGNRTSHQIDSQIIQSAHNDLNQLSTQEGGGWMRFRGQTNEPSSVTVQSNTNPPVPATTDSGNGFTAWVQANSGNNDVTVQATDRSPNANVKTQHYQVNVTGMARTVTYDLNGNTTNNGAGQIYAWDAEDRLIKITYADSTSTEFVYDGRSRRVKTLEKSSGGTVVSEKRWIWAGGNQPAEQRNAANETVVRYFDQGEQVPGASAPADKLFYTKDHLGSVREMVDQSKAVRARYDYETWGGRTKLSGDLGYWGQCAFLDRIEM